MNQHPENHEPPPSLGLRLAGDVAREIAALRKQVEECESHNTEVQGVVAQVRIWAQAAERAAITRLAQGTPDPRYWQGQADAAKAVWEIVKPAV
jgi:mannose/cellobiose epimerase-like protein (N-acyl-D-glucosamine 2-epimerase family)